MRWALAMQGETCPISNSTASATWPGGTDNRRVANDPTVPTPRVGIAPRSMKPTLPFFSIIVPTYCRPQPLRVCLASLAHLDYPHESLEVIIVDDGGQA